MISIIMNYLLCICQVIYRIVSSDIINYFCTANNNYTNYNYRAYVVLRIVPQTCHDVPHTWDSEFGITHNDTHGNCNISLAWYVI